MPQARDEAGNIWDVTDPSNPVLVTAAAAPVGGVYTLPADPVEQERLSIARQNAVDSRQDRAADNARADALLPYQQRKAAADAAVAERRAAQSSRGGAQLTPAARSEALQAYNDADALERAANEIERLYQSGPGATSGIYGLQDYLPTDTNRVFNDAGQRARGYVKRALGFTGGEGNTVAESSALYDPFLPTAGDRDAQIEQKIEALRQLANDARNKSQLTLGGRPDDQGNIVPVAPQAQRDDNDPLNALAMNRIVDGGGPGAAGFGATTGGGGDIPPAMQAEYQAGLANVMRDGRFDPQAYAQFRTALDEKYGFPGTGYDSHLQWAEATNERLAQGGATLGTQIPAAERDLTATEQFRNNLVSNPLGAAVAGAADASSFGTVSALAPDATAALGNEQPLATLAGQIGGSIGGVSAIARASRALAGRAAPQLLGGGAGAQFGRNAAADAAYGAAYGANTNGDPLTGAALAAGGSVAGQGLGRVAGAAVGGGRLSQAAAALEGRGVPLTVGRRLGDMASRAEDKLVSLPIVGDMVRRRAAESFESFNRAAFNEAGTPIGFTPTEIGERGVEQLRDAVGNAYEQATAGVNVPLDPQFAVDMAAVTQRGAGLPPDLRQGLAEVLNARMLPVTDTGAITGNQYQQAMRALRETRRNPPQRFQGFEQDYKDAITGAMDALTGQVQRGGGQGVVDGLAAANAANRNMKIIENASLDRARIGTRTGEVGVFAPSQLVDAARAAERRYPGANALKELGENGQRVLPSTVPNSGTADRLIQNGLLGGLALGGSAGVDAYAGTGVTPYTAAALALLAAGGTRAGQNLAGRIINQRPATVRRLGDAVNRRRGLFGSALAGPLVIAGQ
jgi:hypothetical protein